MISDHTLASVAAINDAGLKCSTLTGAVLDLSNSGTEREMIRALELLENQLRVINSASLVVSRARAELNSKQHTRWQLERSLEGMR